MTDEIFDMIKRIQKQGPEREQNIGDYNKNKEHDIEHYKN